MKIAKIVSSQFFGSSDSTSRLRRERDLLIRCPWPAPLAIVALTVLLASCSGGDLSSFDGFPNISGITPNTFPAGGLDHTITINGTGFNSPQALANGTPLAMLSATNTQIVATLPASMTMKPGTVLVGVLNLLPSGNVYSKTSPVTITNGTGGSPAWTFSKTHTGNFMQGQTGATFMLTATNSGTGPTDGSTVTVTDLIPGGLLSASANGSGWLCSGTTSVTCTRNDVLPADSSYPSIMLTANVSPTAPATITNTASLAGGGASPATASDTVTVTGSSVAPAWTFKKTHTGNFTQGQTGATFMLTATNSGTGPTNGSMVTVTDTIPSALGSPSANGSGWSCSGVTAINCTRNDVLAAGLSYPAIMLTANVSPTAPATITNTASLGGGGASGATASDTVTVIPTTTPVPDLTVTKSHTGNFTQGAIGQYTITVKNIGTGPTTGTVTMTDALPPSLSPSLTLTGGTGWSCGIPINGSVACSTGDSAPAGGSFPPITLSVFVSTSAPATVVNTATVSGGGETNTSNNSSSDTTVINPSSGGAVSTVTAWGPTATPEFTDTNAIFNIGSAGGAPLTGATVVLSSSSSEFTPGSVSSPDPWSCVLSTLTCTRSDSLAPGASYSPIILTYQVPSGAGASITIHAAVSGGGAPSTSTDLVTPLLACLPSSTTLCGQYSLFVQGFTSAGPKAIAASFTADGNGHITAGVLDANSSGAPVVGVPVLTASPTAFSFEAIGFGNIILNTSAGTFVFEFAFKDSSGAFGSVIEYEPSGTASGSGTLLQQRSAFTAASVSGNYAYSLTGGPGGASSGVREGLIGVINANGTCGFSASGPTGTLNNGGAVSTAVNFSGVLNPASCSVDPATGRGTGTLTSVTGSPSPSFSTVHFAYYPIALNANDYATTMVVISTDQTSATQPLLSGTAALQTGAPFNTNAALDCGVAGNPTNASGCVFASSGATGGNSLTGSAHVTAGRATVTTQSNTAGHMSLLLDDNKAGVINSATITATYSYASDGTGVITPSSGEPLAFVLTGVDTGISLGTGGSVASGLFVPQKATVLNTPQLYVLGSHFEGTIDVTNSVATLSATPSSPGSNSGNLLGFIRFWDSTTHQNAATLMGTYTTDPATGRGTGTTNLIPGASTMGYYVIDSSNIALIGITPGDVSPVLMLF